MKSKHFFTLLLAIILVFSLSACGEGKNGSDTDKSDVEGNAEAASAPQNGEYDGSSFGIDLTSTEVQQMSDQRATQEKLSETLNDWCEGLGRSEKISSRTYKDFVDYIGCDATEYYYDKDMSARVYAWRAEDNDTAKFGLWVVEVGGEWKASAIGTTNLMA